MLLLVNKESAKAFPFLIFILDRINFSMSVEINCGQCGKKISTMKMLKSVKDIMKHHNNKCPHCGQKLSSAEFSTNIEKRE